MPHPGLDPSGPWRRPIRTRNEELADAMATARQVWPVVRPLHRRPCSGSVLTGGLQPMTKALAPCADTGLPVVIAGWNRDQKDRRAGCRQFRDRVVAGGRDDDVRLAEQDVQTAAGAKDVVHHGKCCTHGTRTQCLHQPEPRLRAPPARRATRPGPTGSASLRCRHRRSPEARRSPCPPVWGATSGAILPGSGRRENGEVSVGRGARPSRGIGTSVSDQRGPARPGKPRGWGFRPDP